MADLVTGEVALQPVGPLKSLWPRWSPVYWTTWNAPQGETDRETRLATQEKQGWWMLPDADRTILPINLRRQLVTDLHKAAYSGAADAAPDVFQIWKA